MRGTAITVAERKTVGNHTTPRPLPIRQATLVILAGWTLLIAASLGWNIYQVKKVIIHLATIEAQASINKDMLYRRWVARQGGVYVVPSNHTPPNPYLTFLPNRDLTTADGLPCLRHMRPFLTEEPCLKRHAAQGYQKGDIRGGISVSVPMAEYYQLRRNRHLQLAAWHLVIFLTGGALLILGSRQVQTLANKNIAIQEAWMPWGHWLGGSPTTSTIF